MPYEAVTRLIAVAGIAGKLVLGDPSDSLGRIRIIMPCCVLLAPGSPVHISATQDYFSKRYAGKRCEEKGIKI